MFQTASRHLKCPCRNRERCFAVGLTHVWVSSRSVYSNRHDMEWRLLKHRGSGSTAEVIQCRADKSSDLWEGSNGASGSGATAESYWNQAGVWKMRQLELNWLRTCQKRRQRLFTVVDHAVCGEIKLSTQIQLRPEHTPAKAIVFGLPCLVIFFLGWPPLMSSAAAWKLFFICFSQFIQWFSYFLGLSELLCEVGPSQL